MLQKQASKIMQLTPHWIFGHALSLNRLLMALPADTRLGCTDSYPGPKCAGPYLSGMCPRCKPGKGKKMPIPERWQTAQAWQRSLQLLRLPLIAGFMLLARLEI